MPAIAYTPRWLPSMMMVMMKRPKGVTYIELLFCFFFIFASYLYFSWFYYIFSICFSFDLAGCRSIIDRLPLCI